MLPPEDASEGEPAPPLALRPATGKGGVDERAPFTAMAELRVLFSLAWPIMLSMALMFALNIEDQVIVGQLLTKRDLAACAIANVFFNLFWYFLCGAMSAVDTFAQAYGANALKMWAFGRSAAYSLSLDYVCLYCLCGSSPRAIAETFSTETGVCSGSRICALASTRTAGFCDR